MARKRKKSKARKKKTPKDQASDGAASVSSDAALADAEDATAPDDPGEAEPEVIDLTLDDDLDDEAARARLIAEAAGLATGGEAAALSEGDEPAAIAAEDHDTALAGENGDTTPAGEDSADARAHTDRPEEAPSDATAEAARHTPNPDIPTLTPAALAALTAIHREGVASPPGELVLDLGEATTEEERDRLLAAALAHVEMQEAIYRVPSDSGEGRHWKGTIASSLFLLAALVVVVPPRAILPAPPAVLSDADYVHGVRVSLLLQSQQIDAFRTRAGRLPDSLDEVAAALPGIRFVKSNNRLYQLVGHTPAGEAIVYDSASPEPEFQAIGGVWAGNETGS